LGKRPPKHSDKFLWNRRREKGEGRGKEQQIVGRGLETENAIGKMQEGPIVPVRAKNSSHDIRGPRRGGEEPDKKRRTKREMEKKQMRHLRRLRQDVSQLGGTFLTNPQKKHTHETKTERKGLREVTERRPKLVQKGSQRKIFHRTR